MNEPDVGAVLQRFVRGELAWSAMEALGASINFDADRLHLTEKADSPVYAALATDVAKGLLAHWAHSTDLQEWARVLLATGMVDLACLEDDPGGDALLEALWASAAGTAIDDETLDLARELAESS